VHAALGKSQKGQVQRLTISCKKIKCEPMESTLGSVIVEFIGALTKWMIYCLIRKIKAKEIVSFHLADLF